MSYITLKLRKYTLVLTEEELNSLLNRDIDLWEKGIKRGKMILRNNNYQNRLN